MYQGPLPAPVGLPLGLGCRGGGPGGMGGRGNITPLGWLPPLARAHRASQRARQQHNHNHHHYQQQINNNNNNNNNNKHSYHNKLGD